MAQHQWSQWWTMGLTFVTVGFQDVGSMLLVVGCFKDVGIVMGKGNGTRDIDVVGRFVVVELWVVGTYVSAFVGLHVPSSSVGLYIGRISLSLDGEGVFGSITSMDQYRLLSDYLGLLIGCWKCFTLFRLLGTTHWTTCWNRCTFCFNHIMTFVMIFHTANNCI